MKKKVEVYAKKKAALIKEEDGQLKMNLPDGPKRIRHDWRRMYTEADLEQAKRFIEKGQYSRFMVGDHNAKARIGNSTSGFQAEINGEADSYSHGWDPEWLNCTCVKGSGKSASKSARSYYYRSYYEIEKKKQPCSHTAALFMLWEKQHGVWEYEETEEEKKERLENEERERLRREAEAREKEEQKRRLELKKQETERRAKQKRIEGGEKCSGKDFLDAHCKYGTDCFFDVKKIASHVKTNLYEVHRAQKLLSVNGNTELQVELKYGKEGSQQLSATAIIKDEVIQGESGMPSMILSRDRIAEHRCNCGSVASYWLYNSTFDHEFCAHELVLLCRLNEYINQNNPGDATDLAAFRFFKALEKASFVQEEASKQVSKTKERNLVLQPLLTMDGGVNPRLSFRIGLQGGKLIILKNLRGLQDAYEQEKLFSPSKTVQIDFSRMDFDEDSQPWLTFILHRISDTDHVNNSMSRNSWYSVQVSVQNQEVLEGALLDRFYDTAEGKFCYFQNKSAHNGISSIRVGHKNLQVSITSDEIRDSGGKVIGVELKGYMPVILKGASDGYILDEHALSRISKEEERALRPFGSAADAYGNICFRVGKDKLAEFYYRVVPELMGQSFIDFTDHVADKIASQLPPEPEFTFRLDLEENKIYCAGEVAYAGKKNDLKDNNPGGGYRDVAQEERVEKAIERYFPETAQQAGLFSCEASEEAMYQVLQFGIAELSKYGTVLASEAFQKIHIRKTPQFQLGISVESGILDLELLSKDISPDELLEVLNSYRKKKRYHVLKNGDFVTFSDDESLDALLELSAGMDLDLKKLAKGKMHLPAYRALYLDKLLEEHDALNSCRDRTYRGLIKNFRTIRDADYEISGQMEDVLRPYQTYGYKWLRTLQAAGFGGILADEMGLGKTIQAISLFQAWHEEGLKAPVLVVCPASLVYNWQEEIRRFAPDVTTSVIAGSTDERKSAMKVLASSKAGRFPEINIISYDLLRRDIALFEKVSFHAILIDEAQYIKNQKAAMTKAVKGVKADYRFALTGTPIENRLAELWSIFDFLMPGFLYDYATFSERFETPIVKSKDKNASDKLKQMVGPFILRRLKAEVLKDLPEKLEEVRYARFDETQRKVYDGQVVLMRNLIGKSTKAGEEKLRILAELTRLREICCDPSLILENYQGGSAKRDACMELVESAIGGGHRMLLFSQFTSMLEILEKELKDRNIEYYKITGSTPKEQRLKLVNQFNEGTVPVFLISLKAGGTGLNLTGADVVIHYDPWWNLAVQNQATDRAHRIGQKNKVTVYRMIIKDTIEEKILAMQEAKKDLADEILSGEGKSLFALSTEELLDLLN